MSVSTNQLYQLAALYDIKTSYLDMDHRVQPASVESLLAVLKVMGAPIDTLEDVPSAIRARQMEQWQQILEPVIVVWEKEILTFDLRLPASRVESFLEATLEMENGEKHRLVWRGDRSSVIQSAEIEGTFYKALRLYFPGKLPLGYHKLNIELPGKYSSSLVISAPLKVCAPQAGSERIWGVFLPLYALHTHRSWGAGDFGDLETLMSWVSQQGGHMIGTLPLMPSFFTDKYGPGPYMPASRLFWNEFYLDLEQVPELKFCPGARELMSSPGFREEIDALRSSDLVNYPRQMALKRRILEDMSSYFFTQKPERFYQMRRFAEQNSSLEDYACFRAAGEQNGIDWTTWPEKLRDGELREGDYAENTRQYHLYSQWLTQEQVRQLTEKFQSRKVNLYLDLPVGVHPCSYDVWRERESFVQAASGGAPPDPVFTSGQNWGFPPLHPNKIRHQGYRYLINVLRRQLECADTLRIDHMMNFHRLFWIPEGTDNRDGVYVGYRAEELYAILALESCRHNTIIVGEDLGMVPPEVRPAMEKHGLYRMYVGQYELITENRLGKIPEQSVASLNTHDMFPFSAFWQETDIDERQKLKLVDRQRARKELEERRNVKRVLSSILQNQSPEMDISLDVLAVLKAVLYLLAASPAYALLINLEDLWLETVPQNVPGTLRSQNWSRRSRLSCEELIHSAQVLEILSRIDQLRKGAGEQ